MNKLSNSNEKGISLIEVLASIVILTIILITFINFFPQMGQKNIQNENKQSAINIAKVELANWKSKLEANNSNFISFKNNPTTGSYPFLNSHDTVIYQPEKNAILIKTKSTSSDFDVVVTIYTQSDLTSAPKKAYQIHIQVYKANNILVSETYGYIFYEG